MNSEIVRLYLNGSSIASISRMLNLKNTEVVDTLWANPATADVLREDIRKAKEGEFTNTFYDSKPGRDKLPEHKKRKLRQIRISDEEMELMGNPSSTEIRFRALEYSRIFEIIKFLDAQGKIDIPDEWFSINLNDPFWANALNSQTSKFRYLLTDPHEFKQILKKYQG